MLLSSSIIKNTRVNENRNVEIVTQSNITRVKQQSLEQLKEELRKSGNNELENLDEIGITIVESAKKEAEEIKKNAIIDAEEAYKAAYEKGYEEGKQAGYSKAYEETTAKGKIEVDNYKRLAEQNASNLINNAKFQYEKYVLEKEEEIKRLAFSIASKILKRQISSEDSINSMVKDTVENCKNSEVIIIKANKLYSASISEALEIWKKELPIKGDAVVIEDNLLEGGSAIVEKGNGKVVLSVDIGLESIKNELKITN